MKKIILVLVCLSLHIFFSYPLKADQPKALLQEANRYVFQAVNLYDKIEAIYLYGITHFPSDKTYVIGLEQSLADFYIEYKYYLEYATGKRGVVSNPSPNPTAFITSDTCNTSGYFSGDAGEGWIRVTTTAHTCDRDRNEIPGSSISTAASTRVIVWEVSSISANRGWSCVDHNITFTATTNPTGYESYVTWTDGGTPSTGSGSTFTTKWSTWENKTVIALNKSKQVNITYEDISTSEELEACSDKIQHPDEPHIYDGCSSRTGQNPAHDSNPDACGEESSFYGCCYAHDISYQTCGSNRDTADSAFAVCLTNVCNQVNDNCKPTCLFWKSVYVWFVGIVGEIPWTNDQIKYCACCD